MPIRPSRNILCRAYRLNRLNRIDTLCNRVGRHGRSSLQHRVNRERAQANSSWCRSDQGLPVHGSTVKMNSTETSLSAAGSETHNNREQGDTWWNCSVDVQRDDTTENTLCTFSVDVCAAHQMGKEFRHDCDNKILSSFDLFGKCLLQPKALEAVARDVV